MNYPKEMNDVELEAETAVLLPERAAMAVFNFSNVNSWQSSFSGSLFGELPVNTAVTAGFVLVYQN